jgi:hypothetical protein
MLDDAIVQQCELLCDDTNCDMLLVYKFLKLLLIYFFKFGANRLIWDRINFDESTIYCLTFFVIFKI